MRFIWVLIQICFYFVSGAKKIMTQKNNETEVYILYIHTIQYVFIIIYYNNLVI